MNKEVGVAVSVGYNKVKNSLESKKISLSQVVKVTLSREFSSMYESVEYCF